MASIFTQTLSVLRYSRYAKGAVVIGLIGTGYWAPFSKKSAEYAPTKTLNFPSSMLFAKELIVKSSEQINHDTKRITFELPGGDAEISGVPAAGAILTQHTPAGKWLPVLRPYTPVSDPDERGILQLVVKQYPNGRASTYLHSLSPGEKLTVRGPIPGYSWTGPQHPVKEPRSVLLVAGGAGITPIYSLAKGILRNANDQTRIQLLWGVNGTRDIVLKNELEQLEREHPDKLQVTYCVSGPEGKPDAPSLGEKTKWRKGYIDSAVLKEAITKCETMNWGDEKGTKAFICGPPAMEAAIAGKQGILAELGVEAKKIHKF